MVRERKRWTVAFVVWLCVVWGHSLMSGSISSAESSGLVELLKPVLEALGFTSKQAMSFAVRKTAHFSEYAILAALALRMTIAWHGKSPRAFVLAGVIWVVAPCVDESIQLFVPGRAGMPTDILIDMAGGALGLIACWLTLRKR